MLEFLKGFSKAQLFCSLSNKIYLSYKLKTNQVLITIRPDGDCSAERKLKENNNLESNLAEGLSVISTKNAYLFNL